MTKHRLPLVAAAIAFLVHLIGNPHYGFFRDELYFIICGQHPAWGYVDQPPVVPLLAAGSQLFGHSLFLLRAVAALFSGASIYVTCLLIAEMGGEAFAQIFGATVAFFCPVLMNFGMKVSTDMPGLVLWPLAGLLVLRIARGAEPRLWLAVGAIFGAAMESKYTVFFFAVALLGGLLLVPERRTLRTPWLAAGVGVAVIVTLPNAIWQAAHRFPMYTLLENGAHGKNLIVGPLQYLIQEILITNLFLAPIWILGLIYLLRAGGLRFLGYAYLLLIAMMIVLHGKHYYPGDIYPIPIAAGAVAIASWTQRLRLVRAIGFAYVVLGGLVFLPFALPVLSETQMIAYQSSLLQALHLQRASLATERQRRRPELPPDWADMHGWPQMAATLERLYDSLPPAVRLKTVVVAQDYGQASAIAFFTPNVPVVSGHNQYWLWGTRGFNGSSVIDLGGDCGASRHLFKHAKRLGTFSAPYVMPYENDLPIMLCSNLRVPLAQLWPKLQHYN
ncbi:MAG: ArnT family glycosyltransferase [Vulcanimicrobiaceae bacterium]